MEKKFIIALLLAINCFTGNAQNNKMIPSTGTLAAHYDKENVLGLAVFKALKIKI